MHSTRCPFTPVPGTPHTAHCPLDATKHPASGAPPFRGINWREGKRCRQSRQAGQRPPDAQRDAEHFEFVRLLAGGLPAASAELAAAQATRRCSSHIVTSTSSAEARLACDQRKLGPMKAQKTKERQKRYETLKPEASQGKDAREAACRARPGGPCDRDRRSRSELVTEQCAGQSVETCCCAHA